MVWVLEGENRQLRDEVARLNRAMGIATIALRYYSETAIGARAVDALEKMEAKP